MRDNNLMKDGDWMTKEAAAREGLPAHFTDDQIQAKLAEVRDLGGNERGGGYGVERKGAWCLFRFQLKSCLCTSNPF